MTLLLIGLAALASVAAMVSHTMASDAVVRMANAHADLETARAALGDLAGEHTSRFVGRKLLNAVTFGVGGALMGFLNGDAEELASEAGEDLLDDAIPVLGWGLGVARARSRFKADPRVAKAEREVSSCERELQAAERAFTHHAGNRLLGAGAAGVFLGIAWVCSIIN